MRVAAMAERKGDSRVDRWAYRSVDRKDCQRAGWRVSQMAFRQAVRWVARKESRWVEKTVRQWGASMVVPTAGH